MARRIGQEDYDQHYAGLRIRPDEMDNGEILKPMPPFIVYVPVSYSRCYDDIHDKVREEEIDLSNVQAQAQARRALMADLPRGQDLADFERYVSTSMDAVWHPLDTVDRVLETADSESITHTGTIHDDDIPDYMRASVRAIQANRYRGNVLECGLRDRGVPRLLVSSLHDTGRSFMRCIYIPGGLYPTSVIQPDIQGYLTALIRAVDTRVVNEGMRFEYIPGYDPGQRLKGMIIGRQDARHGPKYENYQ